MRRLRRLPLTTNVQAVRSITLCLPWQLDYRTTEDGFILASTGDAPAFPILQLRARPGGGARAVVYVYRERRPVPLPPPRYWSGRRHTGTPTNICPQARDSRLGLNTAALAQFRPLLTGQADFVCRVKPGIAEVGRPGGSRRDEPTFGRLGHPRGPPWAPVGPVREAQHRALRTLSVAGELIYYCNVPSAALALAGCTLRAQVATRHTASSGRRFTVPVV